jgi:branched-chain amino acid transport system permease protein
MIEMVYHLQLNAALGPELHFVGVPLNARSVDSWFGAFFILATGVGLFEVVRRHYRRQWSQIQEDIALQVAQREAP